jgi:hypothetical protein
MAASAVYLFIKLSSSFSSSTSSSTTSDTDDTKNNSSHHDVRLVIKVTINFLQVMYYIGRLSANWSPVVNVYFSIVAPTSLSANFFSIDCGMKWSFYQRLLFIYFTPVTFSGCLLLVYAMRHWYYKMNAKQSLDDAQLGVMLILYLIHPTIMLESVNSMPCESVPGTGTSYLRADMSVDCSSATYKSYYVFAWFYLIFYVFGMIVFVVYRGLMHNAKSGKLFIIDHSSNRKYAFFVRGFQQSRYYWEAVVMTRKLAIVTLSVLLNDTLQLVWGMVFVMIALFGTVVYQPFVDPFINHLESISLVLLAFTIVLGFHYLTLNPSDYTPTVLLLLVDGLWTAYLLYLCVAHGRKTVFQLIQNTYETSIIFLKLNDGKSTSSGGSSHKEMNKMVIEQPLLEGEKD